MNPKKILTLLIITCICALHSESASAARKPPRVPLRHPAQLLDVLCDSKLLQAKIFERKSFAKVLPSGAAGPNVMYEQGERKVWYIEGQRGVAERMESLVINKLVHGKDIGVMPDLDRALKWAFDRQADDGSFPGTDDPYHSAEVFINSMARGFLIIRQSGIPEYQFIVDKYMDKLHLAAKWFIDGKDAPAGRKRNKPFTHRYYILAEAIGTVAALTGDKRLEAHALELAREGIAHLTPEGVSPELGGFDTNYANAGALMAMRYWFVCPDAAVRGELLRMARVSLKLIGERVGEDGSVNVTGDTRVGGRHINRDGKPKSFNRPEGMCSFTLGYYLLGDKTYLVTAANIAKGPPQNTAPKNDTKR